MIPDLGKYALPVLASYGVTIGLLLVIVVQSMVAGRKARAALEKVEARKGDAR